MKRKILRSVKYITLLVLVIVTLYFVIPIVLGKILGSYNRNYYKEILVKKSQVKSITYYISSRGNDDNNGKSPDHPWLTIGKINTTEFSPGDSILFEANQTFAGNLAFDKSDIGSSEKPITISSYGTGIATISAGEKDGISLKNTQGFRICKLNIKANGPEINKGSGIAIVNDLWGNIKLDYMHINAVTVSGFGYWGILVDGNRKKSGFKNVTIENCEVYNNGDAGLYVYGNFDYLSTAYSHDHVNILNVTAHHNAGIPDSPTNTGSGIVVSDTQNGVIERCVAYSNGALCHSKLGGPVGIWAWDSKNIIIQYNESYNNKTGGTKDGGGFDLDGGMENSVLQYNYSHDNEGAGLFLAQFTFARRHKGNTVRYNISYNDGRKNNYAGIELWGSCEEADIYNNTVYMSPAPNYEPATLLIRPNDELGENVKKYPTNIRVINNLFLCAGEVIAVKAIEAATSIKLLNNNYYNFKEDVNFSWNGRLYTSLNEWRSATLQEKDGAVNHGFNINPKLSFTNDTGFTQSYNNNLKIAAFRITEASPMIDAGINVLKFFNLKSEAITDINNNTIPRQSNFDIGACEYVKFNEQTVTNK